MTNNENVTAGILWVLAATFCFVTLDSTMKYALVELHLPITVVVWGRFLFATLLAMAVVGKRLPEIAKSAKPGTQALRSFLLMATTILFNAGIKTTPLALGSTIMFLTPILVTLLSIPILGEHVGARRWAGIAFGFLGALIVVQPSPNELQYGVLFLLGAAFTNASYQITTRQLRVEKSPLTSFLYTAVAGTIFSTPVVILHWQNPTPLGWALLVLCGIAGGLGHLFLVQAFRRAPASAVAPFGYSSLIWATASGFMLFAEWPEWTTFLGAGVIVASGLYIFHRESLAARRAKQA